MLNSDLSMKHMYCVACYIPPSYPPDCNLYFAPRATNNLLTNIVHKHVSVGMAKYRILFCTLLIDLFLTIAKEVTCIWV